MSSNDSDWSEDEPNYVDPSPPEAEPAESSPQDVKEEETVVASPPPPPVVASPRTTYNEPSKEPPDTKTPPEAPTDEPAAAGAPPGPPDGPPGAGGPPPKPNIALRFPFNLPGVKNIVSIENPEANVSFTALFRYSDWLDKIMIAVGTLCALASAGIFPLMFYAYGFASSAFVDFESLRDNITATNDSSGTCFQQSANSVDRDFESRVKKSTNMFVLFGFLSLFLNYVYYALFSIAAERQIKRIRNKVYETIMRQDLGFFDKNTPGELNSMIIANVEVIKVGIGHKLGDFIEMMFRGFANIIFGLAMSWQFSLPFLVFIPIICSCVTFMIKYIKKYTIAEFTSYGLGGQIAQEVLSSIRTVLSLGLHRKFISDYSDSLKTSEQMSIKKGYTMGFFMGLQMGVLNVCFGLGIVYATYLVRTNCDINVEDVTSAFFAVVSASFFMGEALPFLNQIAASCGAARRVYDVLETKSKVDVFDQPNKKKPATLTGDIKFTDVKFSYPSRPDVQILKGLNLNIPAGKTVALVGSSGGGKSTIIGLLQRFYLPSSGKITIDGEDIEELDVNWLRNHCALVQQEPVLFATSIRENIRLGRMDATDAEIEEAAKMANAHNFIMTTTDKYDTQVGERGTQLSGGQKQRIAIARALIRNPRILLLDEATSALDYESERVVQEALDKAKVGRTTIVIAHRLSTIRNADLIVALSAGQFREMGTHDELMAKQGLYYDLVQSAAQTNDRDVDDKKDNEYNRSTSRRTERSKKTDTDSSDEEDEIPTAPGKPVDDNPEKPDKEEKEPEGFFNKKIAMIKKQFKKNPRKTFKYEVKVFKEQKPDAIWIIIGTLGQMVNGVSFPLTVLIFMKIFTIFQEPDANKQTRQSLAYMGALLGIGLALFISILSYNYAFAKAGGRLTKRIRVKMFESMIRQEIGFHDLDSNKSSILSAKLAGSAAMVRGISSDKLSLYAQGLTGVGFSTIYSFALNWKLAFVVSSFTPLNFFCSAFLGRLSMSSDPEGGSPSEEGAKITIETIDNVKTVISLGREKYFIDKFDQAFTKAYKKKMWLLHIEGMVYSLSQSFMFFVQAAAFAYGWILIRDEGETSETVFQIYAMVTFSAMILGLVYSQMPDQSKTKEAARACFRIIDRKSKIDALNEDGIKPDRIVGDIKFENVHFAYPTRPHIKILNGLTLEIKKSTSNALVGPSGCGKSTTIQLLLRFYEPESGTVYLDGVDIKTLNINWLRSKIGLVSQEPTLFNTTIFENICYGDITRKDISIEEVIDAATQANIHPRINGLPEKYQTPAGSRGGQLSGGEKQRIAIARALIRKPVLLMLDEATSALDNQSEQIVQDALDKAQQGRTSIVIAHRLTTIQNSHKITVVKDGKVLEEGTHSQLMNNKNFYYKLQTQ